MIIKLSRSNAPGSHWLINGDPSLEHPLVAAIAPSIELLMFMGAEEEAYFEADHVDTGWSIRARVEDQEW